MFDERDLLLEARHVTRRFPASGGRVLTACNDVNLKFYKGKTLGLIGESWLRKIYIHASCGPAGYPYRGRDSLQGKGPDKNERGGTAPDPSAYPDGLPGS